MLLQSHQPNTFSLCASAEEIGSGEFSAVIMLAWKYIPVGVQQACICCVIWMSLLTTQRSPSAWWACVCPQLGDSAQRPLPSEKCNDVAGFMNP